MALFKLTSRALTENDVERACLDLLRVRGWLTVRIHTGTFRSFDGQRIIKGAPKGTPDYICAHATHPAFLLETKRPHGELSAAQQFQRRAIERGYRIPVVKADSALALRGWLDRHEQG